MILCTKCPEGQLSEKSGQKLICNECAFEIPIQDSLITFHPEDSGCHDGMKPCIFGDVIDMEDKHFWMKARKKLIQLVFEKYAGYEDEIMELKELSNVESLDADSLIRLSRYMTFPGYTGLTVQIDKDDYEVRLDRIDQ